RGVRQKAWLERLAAEEENFHAALSWAFGSTTGGEPTPLDLGLRLAGSLAWYWHLRGNPGAGRAWLEGLLSRHSVPQADAAARAGRQGRRPAAAGGERSPVARRWGPHRPGDRAERARKPGTRRRGHPARPVPLRGGPLPVSGTGRKKRCGAPEAQSRAHGA